MACAAENGKLCPRKPDTVPNMSGPETEPVSRVPLELVKLTRSPLTEPCSDTSLARPAFRSAAAFLPLMAIASVTWSPLLRPAYRACSGAEVAPAGKDVAVAVGVGVGVAPGVPPGLAATALP